MKHPMIRNKRKRLILIIFVYFLFLVISVMILLLRQQSSHSKNDKLKAESKSQIEELPQIQQFKQNIKEDNSTETNEPKQRSNFLPEEQIESSKEADQNPDSIYYFQIPEGHGEGAAINFQEYGRNKKRYTKSDLTQTRKIEMPNIDDVAAYIPDQYTRVNYWLCGYARDREINPTEAKVVGFRFDEQDGNRLEIYFQYNDPDQTLVTILFEGRTPTQGAYIDALPCRWTIEEIENRVYQGQEVQ